MFTLELYESKSGYIFKECEYCHAVLDEMEILYCDTKTAETEIFHQICHNCLLSRCNGRYPAVS